MPRVDHEINAERLDAADAVADEALRWARAAEDPWEIAEASHGKAIAASSIPDLRERVDAAAALLDDAGNVHQLADLLSGAAYAALCLAAIVTRRTSLPERRRSSTYSTVGSHWMISAATSAWRRC